MMLGDVLAAAHRSGADIETWLEPADPDLWEAMQAEAARNQEDTAAFARGAVADFSERASEEDWATAVSKMRDAEDPGRTLLVTMVHWRMGFAQNARAQANEEATS